LTAIVSESLCLQVHNPPVLQDHRENISDPAFALSIAATARQLLKAILTNRALRFIDETKPVARGKKTSLSH